MAHQYTTKMKSKKGTLKSIIGYGIGGVGEDIAYNIFYMFFIFFLTSVAGVDPAAAGTISLFAVAWDAISDPIVGYLSDKYKGNKFGKRAMFILAGAIPLGISVFLLFCDVDMSATGKFIYFIGINILFWMFFTIVDIPYISVASEVTDDYDVKTKMRTSVMLFSNLGQMVLAFGILQFIDYMQVNGFEDVMTWRIIGAVLGALTAIAFILAAVSLRGKEAKFKEEQAAKIAAGVVQAEEKPVIEEEKTTVFSDVKDFFKMKQYRLVAGMGFFYNIFLGIVNSSILYFMMFSCGFDNNQISFINLWPLVIAIPLIVPMGQVVVKLGKKRGMLIAFVYLVIFSAIWSLCTPSFVVMIIMIVGMQLAASVFWITIYAMNFDLSEVYQYKFKRNREGLMISFCSFMTKLGVAIGMWLNGMLMELLGVDPTSEVVTDAMSHGMRVITAYVPCLIAVVLVVLCALYKVSKDKITAIEAAVEARDKNEEYSEEEFKDILA